MAFALGAGEWSLYLSKALDDLDLDTVYQLIDALTEIDEARLRIIYSLIFGREKARTLDVKSMMLHISVALLNNKSKFSVPVLIGFFQIHERRRVTLQMKQLCRHYVDAAKPAFVDCSAIQHLKVPSIRDLPLDESQLVSKEVQSWFEREISDLQAWYKMRLLFQLTNREHLVRDPREIRELWSYDSIAVFDYQAQMKNNAQLFESYRHSLIDAMGYKSLARSQGEAGRTAAYTILHLMGKLSFEQLVWSLPHPYHHGPKALVGYYGDHALSLIKNLPVKQSLYGGNVEETCLILIDALRYILLARSQMRSCPIPEARVKSILRILLIHQLMALKYADKDEAKLFKFFVDGLQPDGETLLFPAKVAGHAPVYSIQLQSNEMYRIKVYNSGAGSERHVMTKDESRYIPYREYRVSEKDLHERAYLSSPFTTDALNVIYPHEKDAVPLRAEEKLMKGRQKSGTCHSKGILFWLRDAWESPSEALWFKAFRFLLHVDAIKNVVPSSYEFPDMKSFAAQWDQCKDLAKQPTPLVPAIIRHYGLRLLKELGENDHGAREMILMALSHDPQVMTCLRIENVGGLQQMASEWKQRLQKAGLEAAEKAMALDATADSHLNPRHPILKRRSLSATSEDDAESQKMQKARLEDD